MKGGYLIPQSRQTTFLRRLTLDLQIVYQGGILTAGLESKSLFGQQKIITQFPSLNFRHSSLITHHSFFHTHLATSFLFSSLNFFTLFIGPTPVSRYSVFFFFFFFFSFPELTVHFFFLFLGLTVHFFFFFNISFGELGTKKKKKYLLTGVGPMNSVKKLSDENKSDVAKRV